MKPIGNYRCITDDWSAACQQLSKIGMHCQYLSHDSIWFSRSIQPVIGESLAVAFRNTDSMVRPLHAFSSEASWKLLDVLCHGRADIDRKTVDGMYEAMIESLRKTAENAHGFNINVLRHTCSIDAAGVLGSARVRRIPDQKTMYDTVREANSNLSRAHAFLVNIHDPIKSGRYVEVMERMCTTEPETAYAIDDLRVHSSDLAKVCSATADFMYFLRDVVHRYIVEASGVDIEPVKNDIATRQKHWLEKINEITDKGKNENE